MSLGLRCIDFRHRRAKSLTPLRLAGHRLAGVDPPSWTHRSLGWKESRWGKQDSRIRRSFAARSVRGLDAAPSTPEAFGAYIRSEIAKWAKVVKAAGIRAQ